MRIPELFRIFLKDEAVTKAVLNTICLVNEGVNLSLAIKSSAKRYKRKPTDVATYWRMVQARYFQE